MYIEFFFFFLWHCSYNWVVSCLFVLSWLAHLILLILFFICQKMEELLMRTKREKPTFIPYFISACKDLPGKFILGYQPRAKPRYVEMFVSYFHERKCEVGCINVVQIYISLFICWKVSGWLTGRLSFMWNALFFYPLHRIEYVTITPDGFRYRSQIFPTVNGLFRWFKDHFQDPVPGMKVL